MNGRALVPCLLTLLAAGPALAQLSPPPGMLTLPKPGATTVPTPAAPPTPPKAAPVTAVQQVAPFADPLLAPKLPVKPNVKPGAKPDAAKPAAAKPAAAKPATPVVQAPATGHAHPASPRQGSAKPDAGKPEGKPEANPGVQPPPADAGRAVSAKPLDSRPIDAKPDTPGPAAEARGSVTNLPLPRWVALRSDKVNLRVGPGLRFPAEWEYHQRDLPVQVLRELDVWRLIRDQDGVKGWVHQSNLVGHRGFVVQGKEAVLRRSANNDSAPVALLKPGVVGRLRGCEAAAQWCETQVGDYRGWLRRDQIWGIDAGEAVGG